MQSFKHHMIERHSKAHVLTKFRNECKLDWNYLPKNYTLRHGIPKSFDRYFEDCLKRSRDMLDLHNELQNHVYTRFIVQTYGGGGGGGTGR